MTDGACPSRDLTQGYLDRIASLDDAGPTLNAVIEVNPRALEDAAALDHEMTVRLYEFKDGLNRYLQRAGARVASLEALIAWNREHADEVMPHFGQELLELARVE